jgi:hypothetical protein
MGLLSLTLVPAFDSAVDLHQLQAGLPMKILFSRSDLESLLNCGGAEHDLMARVTRRWYRQVSTGIRKDGSSVTQLN